LLQRYHKFWAEDGKNPNEIGGIAKKNGKIFRHLQYEISKSMNFSGILVGAAVFLTIGLFHPMVIKMEYYFGKQSWWVFLLIGLVCTAASLFIENPTWSTLVGAVAFSGFWGIHEMLSQEMRVLRGWFPENPRRHAYYERRREELKDIAGKYPSHDHLKEKTLGK